MSIVELDGPPSWSLDVSETGESTNCPWVGVVEGTAGGKIFLLRHPQAINTNRHYPRAFCTLPSFARIKRPRWRPIELNDRHLRSHGKIGDCEQSISVLKLWCVVNTSEILKAHQLAEHQGTRPDTSYVTVFRGLTLSLTQNLMWF